jgi:two-component system chemotaxis response regulator CheY
MIGYGKRVLVVDEDGRERLETVLVLEQVGFTVVQACDGLEAMGEMERRHFDVVVTECHLPQMNGLDLLAQSRILWSATPVIILSNTRYTQEMAEARGAFAWIRRSADPGVLVSILALAVAQGVEQGVERDSLQAKELVGA